MNAKAEALDALALRHEYACITPGCHMNKTLWISVQPGVGITGPRGARDGLLFVGGALSLPHAEQPVDPARFGTQA